MLNACRFARQEILEVNRLVLCPNAAGAAKIRDTGFCADAGACKEHDIIGTSKLACKVFQQHPAHRIYLLGAAGFAGAAGAEGCAAGGGAVWMSRTLTSKTSVFPASGWLKSKTTVFSLTSLTRTGIGTP